MPINRIDFAWHSEPFHFQGIEIRGLDVRADIPLMHRWFSMEYARFWGMQDMSMCEVHAAYAQLVGSGHAMAYLGLYQGAPAFVLECYDPALDALGLHYVPQVGDVGMHFFVGPPTVKVSGFTRLVFRALMMFMFDRLGAHRIVVEPDVRNAKIHVLNREMGFLYEGCIHLPNKLAALAFCTRDRFIESQYEECVE